MKIAILGTENSHALAFAKLIRDDKEFQNMEIVGAYGYDAAANQKLADEAGVTRFAATPDEFLNEVDGVLVTARHGDHHYEYAMPYIKKGIAAFIDKPITVKTEYADEMFAEAEKSGALVCGGSSLKFFVDLEKLIEFKKDKKIIGGHVAAPISMVNDYAGFYFYSQHLIEMLFKVFGSDIRRLYAYCPDEKINRLTVVFDYGDFDVTAHYYSSYEYTVAVFTDKGNEWIHNRNLGDIYKYELREFKEMVETKTLPHTFEELKKPGKIMHLIEKSFREGRMLDVE